MRNTGIKSLGFRAVGGQGSRTALSRPVVALLLFLVSGPAVARGEAFEVIDVAPVWAGHPVHFALETHAGRQYVAFYDDQRRMTVAVRSLDSTDWSFQRLPSVLGWDSHNYVAMAVDQAGFIHVSGNMHGDPLVYFRSSAPHDISAFERPAMVGDGERRVTYPRFLVGRDGRLFFQYRDGKSGAGVQIFNAYDLATKTWRRLVSEPLLDGGGEMSAYLSGPFLGPDDRFHLVWMWRDTPYGSTNHDISYARSTDLVHWETAGGESLELPMRPEDAIAVVDPVPVGGGLAGIAFGAGWDGRGRPVVQYSRYDEQGRSQEYNARWEDRSWKVYQTSSWRYRWELQRTGTLHNDIVVTPVSVDSSGRLTQGFEHIEHGRGTWVLAEESLLPIEVLETPAALEKLRTVESRFPGMEVREYIYDRQGEYFLRWETLPTNRDRRRKRPYPDPSILRVYRALPDGAVQREQQEETAASVTEASLDAALLEESGARIGRISILVSDVFDLEDPAQNRRIFRWVNRLHPKTRDAVIRDELLFKTGELYSARLLEESERRLRGKSYLYDAEIKPSACHDGAVDIEVRTRDVWTLNGGVGFERSGGENQTNIRFSETNFLGTGKELGFSRKQDIDRTSLEVHYRDFNLFRKHGEVEVSVEDNSDGDRYLLHLRRPFFALDTRHSVGITILTEDRIDSIFDRGEVVDRFQHKIDFFAGHWGLSTGLRQGSVNRWKFGFTFVRDQFFVLPDKPASSQVPPDRTLSYPWVDFGFVQDRFVETRDLDKIARTEDLNLGTRAQARLGFSSPAFGGDRDLALLGARTSSGFPLGEGKLLLVSANLGLRWARDGLDTMSAGANARFFWRNWGHHTLYAELQGSAVENLDPERQLLLGGDSGLRGYPLRFQSGDRRLLATLEQRFFTGREIFKLVSLGAAVFFDVGRAWFVGQDLENDLGVLKDVGFGLRLGPTRSGGRTVIHLDVAFPLDGDGSFDSVQWLITTKEKL